MVFIYSSINSLPVFSHLLFRIERLNRWGLWCLTPFSTNISVILLQSFLLVEEIKVPGEYRRPAANH